MPLLQKGKSVINKEHTKTNSYFQATQQPFHRLPNDHPVGL